MEHEEVVTTAVADDKPVSAFSDVRNIDPDKPVDTPEAQIEAKGDEQKPDPTAELTKELEVWKTKAEELEKREPVKEVVYQLPEDYVSIMEDPANRRLLDTDPNSMSKLDAYKMVLREEKPWLTSDAALNNEIKKQFPDADFDIPENLGLPEEEWGEIAFKADGKIASITQQKSDLQAKIEASKQSAIQAKGQDQPAVNVEDQMRFITEEFTAGLAAKTSPQIDIPIEGFQFPSVSDAEIQEMFNNGKAIFKVDEKKGFVPDVQAMHDLILAGKIQESLKPMVEAAKRVAPKEAREAIEASLANKPLHNKDTGGMRTEDPNAKQAWVSPYSDVRNIQT